MCSKTCRDCATILARSLPPASDKILLGKSCEWQGFMWASKPPVHGRCSNPLLRPARSDKGGSKAGIYSDVKRSAEDKAGETTGDKPISQLYQNANATAQVQSVPGSTDAFDKVK